MLKNQQPYYKKIDENLVKKHFLSTTKKLLKHNFSVSLLLKNCPNLVSFYDRNPKFYIEVYLDLT